MLRKNASSGGGVNKVCITAMRLAAYIVDEDFKFDWVSVCRQNKLG